jgi:hypothetical protein
VRKIRLLKRLGLVLLISSAGLTEAAFADGTPIRHVKKIRHIAHAPCTRYDRCGLPRVCPDGTCYSLYGGYGPYGGPLYWSRYTSAGWGYRW